MTLWLGAATLLVLALSFVLVPAYHRYRRTRVRPLTSLIVAALLVPFAIGLYLNVTTWVPEQTGEDPLPGVAEMVARVEERLALNPNDVPGWRLLGQSYLAMGRYEDARRALREAWRRTPEPDNELRVALGEAEALADRESLAGEAGALFETALASDPNNQKALWYGGLAALLTERPELARERWSRLLAFDPPEPVARVLREQIALLGGAVEGSDTPPGEGGAEPIRLLVSVDDALAEDVTQSSSLFIFARSPEGGPPVAVLRASADALPGEFALGDANAMLPGRSLADFDELTIVARVSASGQPTAQSGDLYGEISYRPGEDLSVQPIVIDRTVP